MDVQGRARGLPGVASAWPGCGGDSVPCEACCCLCRHFGLHGLWEAVLPHRRLFTSTLTSCPHPSLLSAGQPYAQRPRVEGSFLQVPARKSFLLLLFVKPVGDRYCAKGMSYGEPD